MGAEKKLVIFCSASAGIDQKYNTAAEQFVRSIAGKYTVVSGGTVKGTMGVVSRTVSECGGKHIGIIPKFMDEFVYDGLSEGVWTETMSERKEKMRDGTCAAVALPGGIGTLDELVETLALAKLKQYHGQIFALNIDGFYDKFKELLDFYAATGMMDKSTLGLVRFPATVEELVSMLG